MRFEFDRAIHFALAAPLLFLACSTPVAGDGDGEARSGHEEALSSEVAGVTFKTQIGNTFIGANDNGGGDVVATAAVPQAWETFTLIDVNGGTFTSGDQVIVKTGGGFYFQALNGGGSTLNAASENQLDWETFRVVKVGGSGVIQNGDEIGLQTITSGAWVSAQNGGGGPVFAYGAALGPWEKLTIGLSTPSSGGGSGGGGAIDSGSTTSDVPPAPPQGASVPYWEYEAEQAATNGVILAPSRAFGDMANEASARSAVRLDASGQYVRFTTAHTTSSIVVRYAIPDAPGGGGANATLGLYVNGVRTTLSLTSRYSWTYGDADAQGLAADKPGGTAHHFYDEVHARFAEVPAGATIALQRDPQDTAAFYVIDLIDLERVPPAIARPSGSMAITDFGATANDGSDDGPAIQSAIDSAKAQGKVLWIPEGNFDLRFDGTSNLDQKNLSVSGVTIRGAGMWYSALNGFGAQFKMRGTIAISDIAIQGDVTYRDDTKGWNAFDGYAGVGSRLDNLWIEHEKCGLWVGRLDHYPVTSALTDGLVVHGARIRNTFADGVNFANGTKNSTVENSHLRNNGDDALATWSNSAQGEGPACENNRFQSNTVEAVWRATCFAIYGGNGNAIQNNTCADTSNYPGILLATTAAFTPYPFGGTTLVQHNTLTRAGGKHYGYDHGALKLYASYNAIQAPIQIADLLVDDPTLNGIQVEGGQAIANVVLDGVTIRNYGTVGMWITGGMRGSLQASNVGISGAANRGLQNDSGGAFTIQRGAGNTGF